MTIQVTGRELLAETRHPCVFWVIDGTTTAIRRGLRAGGWRDRLRVVSPVVGLPARRRGPSVAILVEDPVVAADYLAQLLPVTVVPVWCGGAFTDDPLRLRIGSPIVAEPDETTMSFTDRVADAAEALAAEERYGWWRVRRGALPVDAATIDPDLAALGEPVPEVATPPVPPGGWRQQWARTQRLPEAPGIWQ